jgi:hypothetical protein
MHHWMLGHGCGMAWLFADVGKILWLHDRLHKCSHGMPRLFVDVGNGFWMHDWMHECSHGIPWIAKAHDWVYAREEGSSCKWMLLQVSLKVRKEGTGIHGRTREGKPCCALLLWIWVNTRICSIVNVLIVVLQGAAWFWTRCLLSSIAVHIRV